MGKKSQPDKTGPSHPPARQPFKGLEELVELARRVTIAADAPVVGGVAVALYGGVRITLDIDIYSENFWATHERLEKAGIRWNGDRREHLVDGVAVRMVGPDSLGGQPKQISTIRGVKVIGLADLVRAKLTVGLEEGHRHKDIAHVLDLIELIPLRKDFAAKLPTHLRAPFKALVEQVHGPRRTSIPPRTFMRRYGSARASRTS